MKLNYVFMGLSIILIVLGVMLIFRSNSELGRFGLSVKSVYGIIIIAFGITKFITTLLNTTRRQ